MVRSTKKPEIQPKEKKDKPQLTTDYMSGSMYLLEKCPYCMKEITQGGEDRVRVPIVQIEIKKRDKKLDKLYHIKHKINKPKTFCNLECFIKYMKENTSEDIQSEIINSFK